MDIQSDSLLLQRAIRQFTPDVFQHPVWIRFAAAEPGRRPVHIQTLLRTAREMRVEGDLPGACSLLFLCAARLAQMGNYPAALESITQVLKLAKHNHLPQVLTWGYWAAGAVCTQMGEFQQAANFLHELQAMIKTSEWILADLVEMIAQTLENMPWQGTLPALTSSVSIEEDASLRPALNALLEWGKRSTEPGQAPAVELTVLPTQPIISQRRGWRWLLQWIHSGLQPGWAAVEPTASEERPAGERLPGGHQIPVSGRDAEEPRPDGFVSLSLPAGSGEAAGTRQLQPAEMFGAVARFAASSGLPERSDGHLTGAVSQAEIAQPAGNPILEINYFGAFRLYQDNQLINDWPSQKSLSIFKYLAANRGKPVAKDILMDYFWADADAEVARRNLHQAIYALRQALKQGRPNYPSILFDNDCYLLNPDLELWLDYEEFERHINSARRLEEASNIPQAVEEYCIAQELYQGDFLEDDLYEEWPNAPRTYYRTLYMDLLNRLCEYYIQQNQYYPAIILCQKTLAKDNCAERAYRNLIRCYLAQDQRQLAVRAYHTCVQVLKQELNLAPSEETCALYALVMVSPPGSHGD
jgi:DNA-binding SARP family transcriptional activator